MHSLRPFLLAASLSVAAACGGSNFAVPEDPQDGATDATTDGVATDGEGLDAPVDGTAPPDGSPGDGSPIDATGGGDTATDGSSCPGSVCGGSCTDLATDPKNCGSCGKVVCHAEVCRAGAPACSPGFKACGATGCLGCKNTASDGENCGACGVRCGVPELCIGGKCTLAALCPAGSTKCPAGATLGGAGCTDLRRDPANCGACGKACAPGQFCVAGDCIDYKAAPGCTTCPCTRCSGSTDKCCKYADTVLCASACPGG